MFVAWRKVVRRNNLIIKTTSIYAITTHRSQFGDNYIDIFVTNIRFQEMQGFYQLVILYSIMTMTIS